MKEVKPKRKRRLKTKTMMTFLRYIRKTMQRKKGGGYRFAHSVTEMCCFLGKNRMVIIECLEQAGNLQVLYNYDGHGAEGPHYTVSYDVNTDALGGLFFLYSKNPLDIDFLLKAMVHLKSL